MAAELDCTSLVTSKSAEVCQEQHLSQLFVKGDTDPSLD